MTNSCFINNGHIRFAVQDNCIQIGRLSLKRLAMQVGSTPFYAYERKKLTDQIALLRQYLPSEIYFYYAIKANPMIAVVQHLASLVDGFDVASMGEMSVALDTIIAPERISFSGPGKTEDELICAIAAGIVLNIESEQEMEHVARLGKQLNIIPKITVRINPDFELKFSGLKMGGVSSQFGIDPARIPEMKTRLQFLGIEFMGFHIFCGSQNLNADAILQSQEKIFALCTTLVKCVPNPIRVINMGGGFGVPYFSGEQALDLVSMGKELNRLLVSYKKTFRETRIVIELGRYIVAEAGFYVCRVLARKISKGKIFLVTDGGLHHHLAASGNLGQVVRKNYPIIVGNKIHSTERELVTVTGPLCTPLDILADQTELAKTEVGDLIVILQSGAYGLTASPTAFLSHPLPKEVLI